MKRAVIYARVSTQRQADDGVSMDSQIDQCRRKAAELGAEVIEVFRDDGISGRSDKRPGFQEALALCARQKVHFFICWSTSRFGRNLEEALKNANKLREWGTRPAYVHQDVDLETDSGWMLGVMLGMMDEVYSRNVARDTLRSQISNAKEEHRRSALKSLQRDLGDARRHSFIIGIKVWTRDDWHPWEPCPRGAELAGVYLVDEMPCQYPADCPDEDVCACTLREFIFEDDSTPEAQLLRDRIGGEK